MIIFGTRVSASPREVGDFACPRCQSMQPYQEFVNRRWFTLYFIPVIPLGTAGQYVQCFGCGSQFDPRVLTDLQKIGPAIADVRQTSEASVVPMADSPLAPAPTSALAITSLAFALISPVVLCMCGLSLLTSLIAIVTGHMSLVGINRSAGQLAGRGVALAGVIVGYVMFAISLLVVAALLPGFLEGWRQAERQHVAGEPAPAADGLNRLLDAETPAAATGESEAAVEAKDDFTPQAPEKPETAVEDHSSASSIPVRRSPMTRKLVMGPLIPDIESPNHFSGNQPPPGPVADSPAEPRPAAPTIEPKTERNQAPAAKIVQQFPEMGWSVEALAFAPNGRWLAAGKLDRSLLMLDVETGTTSSRQEDLNELGQVVQVAFSADGQYVVAVGYSGAVMRWSIDEAGALTDGRTLSRHGGRVESLAISPTAPLLMMGASDGSLIWQSYTDDTNQSRRQKYLSRGALAVHLPAKGTEAMATDGDGLVRIDLKTSRQLETWQLQHASVRAAAFSGDGRRVAISTGYEISVWDTATGQSLRTLEADHETQWSVAFLRGGRQLISGGRGQATLWDLENGQAMARFDLGNVLYVKTLAVSPDETLLATIPASAGQTLSVFQIPD